jgi:hypothetical protein
MGWALRNLWGRLAGSRLGLKRSGLHLGRLMPKAIVSCPARILPERTPMTSSRVFLGLPPHGGGLSSLLKTALAFTSVNNQSSIQPELSPETYSGGGSSCLLKSASALPPVNLTLTFFFPALLDPELPPTVSLVAPPALASLFLSSSFSDSSCGTELPAFAPPLSGASKLGEKIRSSPPLLLNSKPFQHYYRRARELRESHSMNWNDGFRSDSLEALKTAVELPLKKVAEPPVKKYFLRKRFLNSRQSAPSQEVRNGFSQTQASTVNFDHNREIDV